MPFPGWRGLGGTKDFTLLGPSLWPGPLTMCTLAPSVRRCAMGTAAASTAPSASATPDTRGQPAKSAPRTLTSWRMTLKVSLFWGGIWILSVLVKPRVQGVKKQSLPHPCMLLIRIYAMGVFPQTKQLRCHLQVQFVNAWCTVNAGIQNLHWNRASPQVENNFGSKLCFDGSLTLAQTEHLQVRQTAEGFKVMSFLTTSEIWFTLLQQTRFQTRPSVSAVGASAQQPQQTPREGRQEGTQILMHAWAHTALKPLWGFPR